MSIVLWFIPLPAHISPPSPFRPFHPHDRAGTYPAIKLDLQLKKIRRDNELEPHKKFRHASIWVSDDSDRVLLRVEASIFVGTIYAELQSIRFPNEKSLEARLPPTEAGSSKNDLALTIGHPLSR